MKTKFKNLFVCLFIDWWNFEFWKKVEFFVFVLLFEVEESSAWLKLMIIDDWWRWHKELNVWPMVLNSHHLPYKKKENWNTRYFSIFVSIMCKCDWLIDWLIVMMTRKFQQQTNYRFQSKMISMLCWSVNLFVCGCLWFYIHPIWWLDFFYKCLGLRNLFCLSVCVCIIGIGIAVTWWC